MNTDRHKWEVLPMKRLSVWAASVGILIGSAGAFAQSQPASSASQGLDSLTDDALMNELAGRGLDTLLDRAFELNKVPESERKGRRTLLALSRLSDSTVRLTGAQRDQLISQIVQGVDAALPAIHDPNLLMRQAFILITQAAERDVNTLEYWGQNPRTQASLRPIAQTIIRLLDRCSELAKQQAEDLANRVSGPNSPLIAKVESLEQLQSTADYTRQMVAYDLALALDPAAPERKQVASTAFNYLKQFNVPENPDRCIVRNRMAKLAMLQGDFDTARRLFQSVLEDSGDPRPTIVQLYEAKYFSAVTEVLAREPDAAEQGLNDLLTWQDANLPKDNQTRLGADAAAAMLKYRILSLQADLATTPQARKQADDAAVAVLMDLLAKREDLRAIIYDQLLPRLGEQPDLTKVEPLLLRALVSKGEQEIRKTDSDPIDAKTVTRALDAAREIIRRKGQSGVDSQMVDAASLLVPFFLDKLGRRAEAAGAFLDYVDQYKITDLKNATLALDNAQSIIGTLRGDPQTREDPAVTQAYERFLPLAIAAPFERKEFAFEYARRLQLNGNPSKAARYFQLVPADDRRVLQARFYQLVALKQQLDAQAKDWALRRETAAEIQRLAGEVNAMARAALAPAKPAAEQSAARSMLARTALLAADMAWREQKDPQQALKLLETLETTAQGAPDAENLINDAMYIRVQANMAAGKYTDATQELVKLLNKTEGGRGAQIVYNLLEKLNADFDRAQQAGDRPAMKTLARNRAELSGFLVKWAETNSDAGIRKFTYRYRVFDAETQRRAAELTDNPTDREAGLKLALQRYRALESDENMKLYRASVGDSAAAAFDPQVSLGIGLIQYDLGEFADAADRLSRLLTARKLGNPTIIVQDNGQDRVLDNDQYWEAVLKLLRSDMKLNRGLDEARTFLKLQYVTWGPRVGGSKWKGDFEQVRQELIPDFKPDATAPATTQSQPLTSAP